MTVDPFAERLARVRQRFVSTLEGKIANSFAAMANLSADAPAGSATVAEAYRTMHGIVGIGPTVGFPSTGRAARDVENVLLPSYRDRRGLTSEEVSQFMKSLQALRDIASRELQVFFSIQAG